MIKDWDVTRTWDSTVQWLVDCTTQTLRIPKKRWPDFSIEQMMANHETIITGWWFGTFGLFSIYWE